MSHLKCVAYAGAFTGLPESPVENITLRNVTVRLDKNATNATGWLCSNVKTLTSHDVEPPLSQSCFKSVWHSGVEVMMDAPVV